MRISNNSSQDDPLGVWISFRNIFLAELHRRDGRADDYGKGLCSCSASMSSSLPAPLSNVCAAVLRCTECTPSEMMCAECMVKAHTVNPLHRIQVCPAHILLRILLIIEHANRNGTANSSSLFLSKILDSVLCSAMLEQCAREQR